MIEFLKNRRSIRKYTDKKIEKEKIDNILKAALLSPSSKNRKPWEFIVIDNENMLKDLSRCRTVGGGPFLANAPLGIVVLADKLKCDVWIEDASIASTLIQLEAEKQGLGSCWVQVRERMHDNEKTAEQYVKEKLNIPENYAVECIISIGYKDEVRKSYEDNDLDFSKVHYNGF